MFRYQLTPSAKNDLQEIVRYTTKSWGVNQAKKYLKELRRAFGTIAQTPKIGRSREELAPELRSFQVGNHIIFYKESKVGINVARILHSKRDIEHQLDQSKSGDKQESDKGHER